MEDEEEVIESAAAGEWEEEGRLWFSALDFQSLLLLMMSCIE